MGRLAGKVAIVTGGGTGIGEAICERFVEEGARLAVFEINPQQGTEVADRLKAEGADARFHQVDVRNEDSVAAAVADVIKAWGRVDILVNNAGIPGPSKLSHECSLEEWENVFAVNVRGVFLCSKHVLPGMMAAGGGSIVNFASIYALIGNDDIPPYHATKGAVASMTRTDAVCYAPHGIRINAVYPGSTMTPLFKEAAKNWEGGPEAYLKMMSTKHPLRVGEPVDVANCVLFLASDESRFVTGASLVCDGGYTAQ